jgi:cutinase
MQGYGIVGGPFLSAVQRAVSGATGYAVVYPAAFGDASPIKGVNDVVKYFSTRPTACPQQKYVIGGYSQGAVVMHRAAVKLAKDILKDRIIATATFGDGGQQATKQKPVYDSPVGPIPVWPEELDGKIKFNCAKGDLTCTPGGTSTLAHMTYGSGSYISDSAKFVAQAYAKSGGASAPPAGGAASVAAASAAGGAGSESMPVTRAMFFRA